MENMVEINHRLKGNYMKITLNNEFACKLSTMLESKLIWYKHYQLFCDDIIEEYVRPPYWIIELAIVRYQGDAVRIVNEYLHSEPIDYGKHSDQYIACLYIRYIRRELSWASFLYLSGQYSDSCQSAKEPCEYFYELLSKFEDNDYNIDLEQIQLNEIYDTFKKEIEEMNSLYQIFKEYYKEFIKRKDV